MKLTTQGATALSFGQANRAITSRMQRPHFGTEAVQPPEGNKEGAKGKDQEGDKLERTGASTSTGSASASKSPEKPALDDGAKQSDPPAPEGTSSFPRGCLWGFGSMTGMAAAGIALTCTGWGAVVGVPLLLASPFVGLGLGLWQGFKKKSAG